MEALRGLYNLRWTNRPHHRPLPPCVTRTFVHTPGGDLELLVSVPKHGITTAPALFFVHGGFGSAGVWLEWMTHVHEARYPGNLYACSVRNHGGSYAVPYFRMAYQTSRDAIVGDLIACVRHAEQEREGRGNLILIAHSAGGGLVQYALAQGLISARALCLVDACPHFGMLDMYWNWFKHDRWFPLRVYLHLGHPASPLSTTRLVRGAFFGQQFDAKDVPVFAQWMAPYESILWPMAQMGSFLSWLSGRNAWLNAIDIVRKVSGSVGTKGGDSVCIMVAEEDMMFDEGMYVRQAQEYRSAVREIRGPCRSRTHSGVAPRLQNLHQGARAESVDGVRLVRIGGAGHHVQNDSQRAVAVEALLAFAEQTRLVDNFRGGG